mgnify:CR=1 FL=1
MTSKIIDVHTHTFPGKIAAHALEVLSGNSHTRPFTDGTIQGLKASMSEAGITCSFLQPVATKPEQVKRINDTAIAINSEGGASGIYSFGGIHPLFPEYEAELERIREAGIIGVKLHPVYQNVPADDERYVKILKRAGELGLIVMIHAGFDIGFPGNDYASPERISRAVGTAGNVRVILAHMGGWKCWNDAVRIFAGCENVYVDTAFSLGKFSPNGDGYYSGGEDCMMLRDDEFVRMVRSFGSERVLFGTDSPWSSQSECVKAVMSLRLDDEDKRNILYDNAIRLLFYIT